MNSYEIKTKTIKPIEITTAHANIEICISFNFALDTRNLTSPSLEGIKENLKEFELIATTTEYGPNSIEFKILSFISNRMSKIPFLAK